MSLSRKMIQPDRPIWPAVPDGRSSSPLAGASRMAERRLPPLQRPVAGQSRLASTTRQSEGFGSFES